MYKRQILSGANSYLDWILMALPELQSSGLMTMENVPVASLVGDEVMRQIDRKTSKEDLLALDCTLVYNKTVEEELKRQLSYEYPFRADMELYAMLSVSEIKRRRQALEAADQGAVSYTHLIRIFGYRGVKRLSGRSRN